MSGPRRAGRDVAAALSLHRGLLEVLVAGAIIRVCVAWTRPPSVFQDSLEYIKLSKDAPFSFSALRPNGYPLLIRIVSAGSTNLRRVTDLQHGAGLLVGVGVYVLLLRLGARRWIAVAAVAVVVLDAYTVALEQDVLTETSFTVAIMASILLVAVTKRGTAALVASGLLLALAVTIRAVGLFAVPVWLVYIGLLRLGWRRSLMALGTAIVPLLAYATFHSAHGHTFGLADGDGWFLYAKVGPIADCSHAHIPQRTRPLCDAPVGASNDFYLFSRASPAQILFFGPDRPVDLNTDITPANADLLRQFSFGVIRAHPLVYSHSVLKDVVHYLGPKQAQAELSLYGAPGSIMSRYERHFRVPWWLLPVTSIVALAALVAGRHSGPGRSPRLEIGLMFGTAWALLIGSAATAGFNPRYTIPLIPLFVCAAALGIEVLAPQPSTDDETRSPTVGSPTVGSPTVGSPTVESPTVESPTVESPTVESPTVEAT